jgi:E-phenylitaconyl-CoA hydratase
VPIPYGDLSRPIDGLKYERREHVAIVTIDRPAVGNSLTSEMQSMMRSIWREVREDPWIRCTLITASGDRHFSTGADVSRVASTGRVSAGDGRITHEVFWSPRQNDVWKPTVVAVNGLANGAGLHLVVDADIVVASEKAAFSDTHVNVGMVGAIENIGLAKRLPLGSALRMTLQGRNYRMTAERAYQVGLVDELVPHEQLFDTAWKIAQDICANSPHAVSLSQQAVWASVEMPYTQAVEYGWALLRLHWAHPDFKEGPMAFAEKRPPVWQDE